MKHVLFLCTGNSCRSIMAEGLLRHLGGARFTAHSAGSQPAGEVNPYSLKTLAANGVDARGFSSKSWDALEGVPIDVAITLCDSAAGEACPAYLAPVMRAHWGAPDPAGFVGTEEETIAEYARVFALIEARVRALVASDVEALDPAALKARLDEIGTIGAN